MISSNNDFNKQTPIFASQDISIIFRSMANLFIIGASIIFKVQVANISILIMINDKIDNPNLIYIKTKKK